LEKLADLAAGTPEFAALVGEGGDSVFEKLIVAQDLLGPLPPKIKSKFPSGMNPGDAVKYSEDALFNRIRNNPLSEDQDNKLKFSDEQLRLLVDLIKNMLAYEASERITTQEALKHNFFR
jgi:serine/threonine protein kinase